MVNSFISKLPKSSKNIVKLLAICLIILHWKIRLIFQNTFFLSLGHLIQTYNSPGSDNQTIIKWDQYLPKYPHFFYCVKNWLEKI